jgi:predicted ATP-dependent serine protease
VEEAHQAAGRGGPGGGLRGLGADDAPAARPVALTDIAGDTGEPVPTNVAELDRVLVGGLVPGSITLLGGEPGIGKSTLVLQALAEMAGRGRRGLLVSAEESPTQVRRRAARLDALVPGLWLVAETSMPGIQAAVQEIKPDVLVVDSIQTVWDPDLDSTPGSVVQVRGCAHRLSVMAKADGLTTILVGHVTKEGTLAGPRLLEHLVDTVLSFDGDRHHALRLLRSVKHRFGPTGELGLFEMTGAGLEGVADPGGLFLVDRRCGTPGGDPGPGGPDPDGEPTPVGDGLRRRAIGVAAGGAGSASRIEPGSPRRVRLCRGRCADQRTGRRPGGVHGSGVRPDGKAGRRRRGGLGGGRPRR